MSLIKDVIIVLHTVVVTMSLRYLLDGYTLNACEMKPCKSLDTTAWNTIMMEQKDDHDCRCCKFNKRSISTSLFTGLTTIHIVITLITIILKRRIVRNHLWVYFVIITIGIVNGFLIARLFAAANTIQDNTNIEEGITWKVVSAPFRLTLAIISTIFYTTVNKLLIQPMGLSDWLGNKHSNTPYICFLKTDDVTMLSSDYGLAVLSWVYMLLMMYNSYTLVKCMNRDKVHDKEQQYYGSNNNNCEDQVRRHVKRAASLDCIDSYSSDEESFVLGWRL